MLTQNKPRGLRKILREINRPFVQTLRGIRRIARNIHRTALGISERDYKHHVLDQQRFLKNVYIGKDKKVHLPNVEYYLTNGCNLKCEHCFHFNPFRSGIVPSEDLIRSFEGWSRRLCPDEVRLLGGEPLLHPQFEEITLAARRIWGGGIKITVITNGILLPKLEDRTLRLFAENDIEIRISKHLDTEEYNQSLEQSVCRLNDFGIHNFVTDSYNEWFTGFDLDTEGIPHPSKSNPKISSFVCGAKRCYAIAGDRLYRCSWLANTVSAINEKAIVSDWNQALSYEALTFNDSPEKILKHLHCRVLPECAMCPEKLERVEARQLSLEQVQRVRRAA